MNTRKLTRAVAMTVGLGVAVALTACTDGQSDDQKVTIRFAQFGNSTDDPSGMKADPIKAAIEKKVGIQLEYDTGTDGFDDRMLTELTAGTGPDLFPTWGETEKITSWIADDAVVDMGSYVLKDQSRYPTLYKMFTSDVWKSYNELYAGDPDKTYAIYSIAALAHPSFGGVPVYNSAILDKVNGGKTPTTVKQFVDFTQKAAAAGYTGWWPRNDKLTNWSELDQTLASPEGTSIAPPSGDAWTGMIPDGDDNWKLMTTSDTSKKVVAQLHEMYTQNALSNGVGVKGDFDDAYAEFGTGQIGAVNFGFGYSGQFRDFYNDAWAKANPGTATPSDLTQGVALQGSAGYGKKYTTGSWMSAMYFIPSTNKHIERVLDLVEYLASAEGQDLLFKGIEGKTFTPAADGSPQFIDGAWNAINKAYGYEDGRGKYVWFSYLFSGAEFMTEFSTRDWYESVTNPVDFSALWSTPENNALVETAQSVIDTFVGDVVVDLPSYYNMIVLSDEAQSIRGKLQEISNRYLPAMIGGQMDIDEAWSKYQAEYEAAGAADYEQMVNDAIAKAKSLS